MLPALAKQQAPPDAGLLAGFDELAKALSRAQPDRKKVAELARTRGEQAQNWLGLLASSKFDRAALQRLLRAFQPDGAEQLPEWDIAEQLYLGFLAWAGPEDAKRLQKPLAELESQRAFPLRQDSPAGSFRADQFLTELSALLKASRNCLNSSASDGIPGRRR